MRGNNFLLIIIILFVIAFAVAFGVIFAGSGIGSGLPSAFRPVTALPETTLPETTQTTPESEKQDPNSLSGEPKILGPGKLEKQIALNILEFYLKQYPHKSRDASDYVVKCYENFDGTYVVSINLDPDKRNEGDFDQLFDNNKTFRLNGCTFLDQDLLVYDGKRTQSLAIAYYDELLTLDEYYHLYEVYKQEHSSEYNTVNHTLTKDELYQINAAWKAEFGTVFAETLDEIGEPGQKLFYGKYGDAYVLFYRATDTVAERGIGISGFTFRFDVGKSYLGVCCNSKYYSLSDAYRRGLVNVFDIAMIYAEHEKWAH